MVRDNVVSNDVTITSALCSDVIIFGINILFLSKNELSGWFMTNITKLCLCHCHSCAQKIVDSFSRHGVATRFWNVLESRYTPVRLLYLRSTFHGASYQWFLRSFAWGDIDAFWNFWCRIFEVSMIMYVTITLAIPSDMLKLGVNFISLLK